MSSRDAELFIIGGVHSRPSWTVGGSTACCRNEEVPHVWGQSRKRQGAGCITDPSSTRFTSAGHEMKTNPCNTGVIQDHGFSPDQAGFDTMGRCRTDLGLVRPCHGWGSPASLAGIRRSGVAEHAPDGVGVDVAAQRIGQACPRRVHCVGGVVLPVGIAWDAAAVGLATTRRGQGHAPVGLMVPVGVRCVVDAGGGHDTVLSRLTGFWATPEGGSDQTSVADLGGRVSWCRVGWRRVRSPSGVYPRGVTAARSNAGRTRGAGARPARSGTRPGRAGASAGAGAGAGIGGGSCARNPHPRVPRSTNARPATGTCRRCLQRAPSR